MKWMILCCCLILSFFKSAYAETLVIGTDQINPPMATKTDNSSHFIGFEVDMMNEICARLKLTCIYRAVIANEIISALETKKIDLAISSIVIPNFHLDGLIFSLPYLPSNAQFMTLKTSPINNFMEIPGKTIGVSLGAFQNNLSSDMYLKHLFDANLKIIGFHNMAELLAALDDHKVDVIFANQVAVDYWYYNNSALYKFIGKPVHIGNGYGILTTAKYSHLIDAVNEVIHQIMIDGTYDLIYQRYFTSFQ